LFWFFAKGLSVVAMQAVPVVVTPAAAVVGVQEVEEQAAGDVQQQADQNGGTIVAVAAAPPLPPAAAAAAAAVVAPPSPAVRPLPSLQAAVGVIGTVTSGVVPLLPRQIVYPLALAKHEEVVASKELFFDTLNKFHTTLGTRLTKKRKKGRAAEVQSFQESLQGIPKIAGKDLDLHLLYIEVTSRGGSQQVIKDRKWKELTVAFNFPSTASGAAYILRKYYIGLLHHYEQVYYFRAQGPLVPPPISLPGPTAMSIVRDPTSYSVSETVPGVRNIRKRNILPIQVLPVVDPALSIGSTVTGAIEGKFDQGYLVSITMGTEKLRGVLYHLPQLHRGLQHASVPNYAGTLGAEPQKPNGEEPSDKVHGRKRKRKGKDPNAPRANRSGYNFFFGEQRMKLKEIYPDKDKELSRMIGDAWNKLTEEERIPYQEQGVKDKERYLKEMKEYRELLKVHQGVIPADIPMLRKKKKRKNIEEKPSEVATNGTHQNETVALETALEPPFRAGAAPQELNVSTSAMPKLEDKDSVLHDLPVSSITPVQESFEGNTESEGISKQGAH